MKRLLAVFLLMSSLLMVGKASAMPQCESLLCVHGLANGESGGEGCAPPLSTYFAKRGIFWFDTFIMRFSYLEECPTNGGVPPTDIIRYVIQTMN